MSKEKKKILITGASRGIGKASYITGQTIHINGGLYM